MYELLTGKHPFMTDSFSRLVNIILNEDPPPMTDYRADVPEALERIVRKAM
jgi:CRP-like cAMP-binding protein